MKLNYKILIFFFCSGFLFAQKEANIWYFGHQCGLDFNFTPPKTLTNGKLNSLEGCASIADENGNLLFYSDGTTVWNSNHKIMVNGDNLYGNQSSTQSAVIVPMPQNKLLYYLFTVDDQAGINGFRYSMIDMSLQNGLGGVVKKNILLADNVTEKVTAGKHLNNKDIWVLVHEWNSNKFKAFLITKDSIFTTPVESSSGTVHDGDIMNSAGYMKVSPKGNKIALAIYYSHIIELFDFNNSTGIVSNPVTFNDESYDRPYGIEFSPNGTKLYFSCITGPATIYQANLNAGTPSQIIKSATVVVSNPVYFYYGALQAAPDGKIYIAKYNGLNLAAIDYPDEPITTLRYKDSAVSLGGNRSGGGLPCYIQSYFKADSLFINSNNPICEGDTIRLSCTRISGATYEWDGPNNFSDSTWEVKIPNSTKRQSGLYGCLIKLKNGQQNYLQIEILVNEKPFIRIDSSGKTSFCLGDSVILSANPKNNGFRYIWSTGDTTLQITAKTSGLYSLTGYNSAGCSDTAYIGVSAMPQPDAVIVLIPEKSPCDGDTITLSTKSPSPGFLYKWSDGSSKEKITIFSSGIYQLTVWNENGCYSSSEVKIDFGTIPLIKFLPSSNPEFCSNDSLLVSTEKKYFKYLWSTGDTISQIYLKKSGTYYLTVEDSNGCSGSAQLNVNETQIAASMPTVIDLGKVCNGNIEKRNVEFINIGNSEFVISNIFLSDNSKFISLNFQKELPYSLLSGEKINFELRCEPDGQNIIKDSIIVEVTYPCYRRFSIFIKGIAEESISIFIPDTTLRADGNIIQIPVIAVNHSKSGKSIVLSYSVQVSFDASSFLPANQNFDENKVVEGIRYLKFSGSDVEIKSSGTLLKMLAGKVLIGDSINNFLKISDIITSNNEICIDSTGGWLNVKAFCKIDLNKFKALSKVELILSPNPTNESSNVTILNPPPETIIYTIYNFQGEKVIQDKFDLSGKNLSVFDCSIDFGDLPSGIYYLNLRSVGYSDTIKLMIIR